VKKIITAILTIFLTANFSFALEAKVEKYEIDFPTAYELMFNNNNSIKAILEEINAKKYKKNAAIGEFMPKVGMNATFVHFDKDIQVGGGSIPIMSTTVPIPNLVIQEKNVTTFGFTALWNVFTGGKILALNSAARAELAGSNLKYKSLSGNLTTRLVERYYGLALAQDVAEVRKMVKDSTEEHLNDAKLLEKEGMIPKSERLHAEVAYKQAKKDYDAAIKDISIVEEGVKNLIKDDNVDLTGITIQPLSHLFVYEGKIAGLNEWKKSALENNPEFKQTEVQKKLAQANYRAHVANYMPTVSIFAYDVAAQSHLASQLPRFGVGAGVNFMLFDGFSRYNNLKAADALRKEVKYATFAAKNDIESLVVKNYNELLKYREEYESTDKTIESAQESLRCAMLAFKEGYGTSLAVTDAQTMLAAIKIQRLNALYKYDLKLAEMLANIGESDKILEYIKNSKEEKL
jgi:outer membrane protein TolC